MSLVQIANNAIPILILPYLVRIIGAEKYGVINFIAAIITYFTLLINYTFDLTATREIFSNENQNHINRVFSKVLYSKCLLLFISSIIFIILLFVLPQLHKEKIVFFCSFLYCISLVITPNWLFQGKNETFLIAMCQLLSKVFFTITVLLFIKSKDDYFLYPLLYSISSIIIGLIAYFYSKNRYNIRLKYISLKGSLSYLFSLRVNFTALIILNIYSTANLILLGFFTNNSSVGIYTAGSKFITVTQTLIVLPLSLSLFPYIGSYFNLSFENGINKLAHYFPVIIYATIIVSALLWFLSPILVKLFFGNQFEPAVFTMRILSFLPVFSVCNNILGIQTLYNLKLDKLYLRLMSYNLVASLILSFMLIKYFTYNGAAVSCMLSEIFITITLILTLKIKKIAVLRIKNFNPRSVLLTIQSYKNSN